MDELLVKYAREKDSAALARLIQVHIGWVYAAAVRQVAMFTWPRMSRRPSFCFWHERRRACLRIHA